MGVGGRRHASAALPPGMTQYSCYIGDWVGLRTDVDVLQNKNILVVSGVDPNFTVVQRVAYSLHTHTHIHTHICIYMHGKG